MRWIRAHRWLVAQAALAALFIQLVASFGHIHFDHAGANAAIVAGQQVEHDGKPSKDDADHDNDICDICATLALTASAQISMPPALPVSVPVYAPAQRLAASPGLRESPHAAFRSRAPPLA